MLPASLMQLYTGSNKDAREITHYNNTLSFTSLGVKVNQSVAGQKGIHTFQLSGQLAHQIGSALPLANKTPSYAQIYVVGDGGKAKANIWFGHVKKKQLSKGVMLQLQRVLNNVSPYVDFLKSSATILEA
ncbi:uncharacterized protein MELLADRAFT_62309 [Melampsora larici-populina 98AG31]|uniref:Uncharacterized protein n=1 Tax=Melampsora larici-populina (strain 98AG31 / pathotype 3-4-7) TaxID=747676 RepID=F4RIH1_MELLP|nr:uncharacterized protein MELLADRAFT_62309 [Melampsora larici-populina 98AG31]EGG07563.1 hypothetical protein MELLADRAFT_62309 [Melampsora larici-populina 98AG31]